MSDINPALSLMVMEPTARDILAQVAKSRYIRFSDLVKQVSPQADRPKVKDTLHRLIDLRLVDERKTSLEDFDTFFITPEGLKANRIVGQASPSP